MKSLNGLKLLLPLLIVAFAFISCDTDENPVGTLDQAVERIPDVQLIDGADNATLVARYDRKYSYFSATLSNTGNSDKIKDGTYYAWCLQMDLPMHTNQEHTGIRLYTTDRDKILNKLSYIVNNRYRYEQANPGLSWKDIQVAFWVIIETTDMRLDDIANILPSAVEGYNANYVNNILNDVNQNGSNFKPGFSDTQIVLTSSDDGELQKIGCETAYGGDAFGGSTGELIDPWWYYFDTEGVSTQKIIAGRTIEIGTVTVSDPANNGNRTITISLNDGWKLEEDVDEPVKIQGYWHEDDGKQPVLPTTRPASGGFDYKGTSKTWTVPDFRYYVIHLDVCLYES